MAKEQFDLQKFLNPSAAESGMLFKKIREAQLSEEIEIGDETRISIKLRLIDKIQGVNAIGFLLTGSNLPNKDISSFVLYGVLEMNALKIFIERCQHWRRKAAKYLGFDVEKQKE